MNPTNTTPSPSVIDRLEAFIAEELTAPDLESIYDSILDDIYSFEKVGGPFETMLPSRVLKEVDPIAYRCGLNDWADQDFMEVNGESYWKEEVDRKKEEFLDNIRNEILDLEEEIEEREAELTQAEEDEETIRERKEELEKLPPSGTVDSEIARLADQLEAFRVTRNTLASLRKQLAPLQSDLQIAERHCF